MVRFFFLVAIGLTLALAGCERSTVKYPYASVAAIPPPAERPGWEFVETLGTTVGPFKATGGAVLNRGPGVKKVRYRVDGERVRKILDLQEEVLVNHFENPRGDSLVVVYKRPPTAD